MNTVLLTVTFAAGHALYPPTTKCLNSTCTNSNNLRERGELRQVILFTLADGACATFAAHYYCNS
jgi:hypothetical protein